MARTDVRWVFFFTQVRPSLRIVGKNNVIHYAYDILTARFLGSTWGPNMGPMLAPITTLSQHASLKLPLGTSCWSMCKPSYMSNLYHSVLDQYLLILHYCPMMWSQGRLSTGAPKTCHNPQRPARCHQHQTDLKLGIEHNGICNVTVGFLQMMIFAKTIR